MSEKCCESDSGLSIAYNGNFLDCVPAVRSPVRGYVLTRSGELIYRENRREEWSEPTTPSVYLFYDNPTHITFLVDTCKTKICKVNPCGRILDCTDNIIYEIKNNQWSAICDLHSKSTRTLVRCSQIPLGSSTFTLELLGTNSQLLPDSELTADQVHIISNEATITGLSLTPGSCTVLVYSTCICNEYVIVIHLLLVGINTARLSEQFGVLNGLISTPVGEAITPAGPTTIGAGGGVGAGGLLTPIALSLGVTTALGVLTAATIPTTGAAPAATPIIAANVYAVNFPFPPNFNSGWLVGPLGNNFSPRVAGDHELDVTISYEGPAAILNAIVIGPGALPAGTTAVDAVDVAVPIVGLGLVTAVPIPRTLVPRFVLLRNNVVVAQGPLPAQRLDAAIVTIPGAGTFTVPGNPVDILESGQVTINVGLGLKVNDIFRIALVDQPASPITVTLPDLAFVLPLPPGVVGPITLTLPATTVASLALVRPTVTNAIIIDPIGTTFVAKLLGPSA